MRHFTGRLGFPRIRSVLALAFVSFLAAPVARAADWPQWQGPDRNAVSKETGLLQEWPKDGPPLAWKAEGLGGGDGRASPVSTLAGI